MTVVGDALAAACQDAGVLARLGGALGDDARARADEMRQSKQARARAMAIAQLPSAANFRGIHASWIEAALLALPDRARADFASNGMRRDSPDGEFDPIAVWLARWVSASLAPMPVVAPDLIRPGSIREATTMSGDRLNRWLSDVGADQLAFATGKELGPGSFALARIGQPPRAGNLGDRRAAIERCRMNRQDGMVSLVGARTIAPYTDAITRRQLALRLPRTRGEAILFELETWAGVGGSASWEALAAD